MVSSGFFGLTSAVNSVVSVMTAWRRRGRAIMMVAGRRRTVADHRGRRHQHRRRCDHCCRSSECCVDKSDDIGCQSDSVISSMVGSSAVMRSSHCRNCANCCDPQNQCDFHSFHCLYPFFFYFLRATIYRARSNPITHREYNLLFLIVKIS